MKGRNAELEERLIDFAVRVIKLAESLPATHTANHIRSQLLRSGTAPAPNYAEAQSAESRSDFIHKLKIALKELRETMTWLRLLARLELVGPASKLDLLLKENDELIAILVASVRTAISNSQRSSPPGNQ